MPNAWLYSHASTDYFNKNVSLLRKPLHSPQPAGSMGMQQVKRAGEWVSSI